MANGCVILRPDPQTLFNQIRDSFSSTVLGGGKVIPESNEWYVIANDYAMAESFYAIADQMWRETNPETACCDNLYAMAARNGVFPMPAKHAEGYAKLTGTPGATVPSSFEIVTTIGNYVSVGSVPLTVPSSGSVVVRIRALTPGPEGNASGDITEGTLTTPVPGIDEVVTICGGSFCGGANLEDCEVFRKRYLERLSYKPRATQAWIKEQLMEFPCVTRVCVREGSCCKCLPECGNCGCINCGTKIEFYVLFDDTFPCGIPPQHVVDDINTWIFGEHQGYGEGQVEMGVCGKIYVPIPLMVDVVIDIEGCPTNTQKQMIEDQVRALFRRICPSLPFYTKQIELIIASVVGMHVNAQALFSIPGYEEANPPYPRNLVLMLPAGCGLEPECDVLPCLNSVRFVGPDMQRPPC